jgi:hypothetical protein
VKNIQKEGMVSTKALRPKEVNKRAREPRQNER